MTEYVINIYPSAHFSIKTYSCKTIRIGQHLDPRAKLIVVKQLK